MEHRDPFDEITWHPDVERALKALLVAQRYLPSYQARYHLKCYAPPLDKMILEALELPEDARHGVLAEIERKFKVNRRTVYRHRDDLCCDMARANLAFLLAYLCIDNKKDHARNIFKILEEM